MTKELIDQLMAFGLTKAQATSATAEALTQFYMQEDGKVLIAEASRQVERMKDMVDKYAAKHKEIMEAIEKLSHVFEVLVEAQATHGVPTDEKAKNTIALYGSLLAMSERMGASGVLSVENAGYITYAYLGGQASRNIVYTESKPDPYQQKVAGRRL